MDNTKIKKSTKKEKKIMLLPTVINPFESIFDDFFSEFNLSDNNRLIQKCKNEVNFPRHNVINKNNQMVVQLAVPGYTIEQLKVKVDKRILSIQGEAKIKTQQQGTTIIARGIKSSYFKKSFNLVDKNLSDNDIKCQLKHGILSVHIKKNIEDKVKDTPKQIKINY